MLLRPDSPAGYSCYECKIESLTVVEQKRDPKPTMESIKRAFRSMFKKKGKPNEQHQASATAKQINSGTTTATSAQPPAAPPKDVERTQTHGAEHNTTGKLPPTHPLSTGRHDRPQSELQPDRAALAPIPAIASGASSIRSGRREDQLQPMTPLAKTVSSEPVSAISRDEPPAPPPKTDGVADAIVAAPMEAAVAAPAVTESQPAHTQPTGEPIHEPGEKTETAHHDQTSPQATSPQSIAAFEDKIPVTAEEPPPIKTVKAAPGMSATSGPLEDFPEGGNYV
ncbi:hypothetical protein LTR10_004667 [Elasticomyces elasticus]|nr:hypothetical protein LTR10_004667 [Elasticomyces elasticus]KAK4976986.1 hypothetical protein LTR42_003032 [Elasticomyces elasticus]